jgi:hypothetical protein
VIAGRSLRDLLPHRPPALLLDAVEHAGGEVLVCTSDRDGAWHWAELLEGAAQCAGLLAGLHPGGPRRSVIAEYRDVVLHTASHVGSVGFHARLDRRVLHFWRCRVEARDAGGGLLLAGAVTLAPERPAR